MDLLKFVGAASVRVPDSVVSGGGGGGDTYLYTVYMVFVYMCIYIYVYIYRLTMLVHVVGTFEVYKTIFLSMAASGSE